MSKRVIGIFGAILTITGIISILFSDINFEGTDVTIGVSALKTNWLKFPKQTCRKNSLGVLTCSNAWLKTKTIIPFINEPLVSLEKKSIRINETTLLFVKDQCGHEHGCTYNYSFAQLDAVKISPKETNYRLGYKKTKITKFIVEPKKSGYYHIGFKSGSNIISTVKITVKNGFGLSLFASSIVAHLLTVLGPILTVPWWLDFFRRRKEAKTKNESKIILLD